MIEHLPQETVDRLTDMRELDLQVQSEQDLTLKSVLSQQYSTILVSFSDSMDNIEKRITRFFQSAYHMPPENLDSEHSLILKEYKKILEDTGKLEKRCIPT